MTTEQVVIQGEEDPILADFRNFLFLTWKHLGLPEPTPMQFDYAYNLQHGPTRAVLEAFRGFGKSWITSAFVCWLLLRNPQLKILVVSASKERADQFSTFTLRLIREMPILQHLAPRDGQRDSKISFDVGPANPDHAPSVKSVGITGQLSGSRADVIVPDDIEVPNNSATQVMRDKLAEAVKEFDAILKPEAQSPNRRVLFLGTPQTEQSVYNQMAERGYNVMIWPAEYPTSRKRPQYGNKLAPYITDALDKDPKLAGQPTDPRRFTRMDLDERKLSYGASGYALQFMLDTTLSDADRYPLKLRDLIIHSLDRKVGPVNLAWGSAPDLCISDLHNVGFAGDRWYRAAWLDDKFTEYTGTVMCIDPSGRGKDETAYAVVKLLHGMLYLVASGGFLDGYSPSTLESLAHTAKEHGVNLIKIELNYGGGMFDQLLKPVLQRIYPCSIDEEGVKSTVQKERRICDTLEPVLSQHRLVVDRTVIEQDHESTKGYNVENGLQYQLFYQLTRITRDKGALARDDRLDALAMAVAHFVEAMARDSNRAAQDHRDDLLDAELRRFMEHAVGGAGLQHEGWINRHATRRPEPDRRYREGSG